MLTQHVGICASDVTSNLAVTGAHTISPAPACLQAHQQPRATRRTPWSPTCCTTIWRMTLGRAPSCTRHHGIWKMAATWRRVRLLDWLSRHWCQQIALPQAWAHRLEQVLAWIHAAVPVHVILPHVTMPDTMAPELGRWSLLVPCHLSTPPWYKICGLSPHPHPRHACRHATQAGTARAARLRLRRGAAPHHPL